MSPSPPPLRRCQRGFTLAELYWTMAVLCGVMALLGLLLPTCNLLSPNSRDRHGNCMGNIKGIIQGLKMYRDDWGVCPDALYGISYDGEHLETRLFPYYIKDEATFICAKSPVRPQRSPELVPAIHQSLGTVSLVPSFSSYDAQLRNPDSPRAMFERHYAARWSTEDSTTAKRQLCAPEPADDTVVTWCLYHAEPDRRTGSVGATKTAIVGFWDGRVQRLPAERLSDWPDADGRFPWQVAAKP